MNTAQGRKEREKNQSVSSMNKQKKLTREKNQQRCLFFQLNLLSLEINRCYENKHTHTQQ